MKFPAQIEKATLQRRYKRFLADIAVDGLETIAHCANPGSMLGLADEGSTIWVSRATNPKRKLGWDWHIIEVGEAKVCINTNMANHIVEEAINAGRITEVSGYTTLTREVKYSENSRIDILLEHEDRPKCYVEVKSVTLSRRPSLAEFPDSKTVRGAKHLRDLSAMVAEGHRAVMVYMVARTDCEQFSLARDIDPDYAKAFDAASAVGVEMLVYATDITPDGIILTKPLKWLA